MKKATTKKVTKKVTQRIPKYRDKEGQSLGILEHGYALCIGWWLPDEGDFGLILTNDWKDGQDDSGETNVAVRVCRDYFEKNRLTIPRGEFEFESMRQAKECLRLINAELFYWQKKKPLPDWAKTALAEGWSPPKGWSP